MPWFLLAVAIGAEVIATSVLKAADGFSRLGPSLLVILGNTSDIFRAKGVNK
jgi:small multidrug resistance pump